MACLALGFDDIAGIAPATRFTPIEWAVNL